MDPNLRRLQHQLLGFLLHQARIQAELDLEAAAARWNHPIERLEAIEAGNESADWWDVRGLIMAYQLNFVVFAQEYDRRAAALCAPVPDLRLAAQINSG